MVDEEYVSQRDTLSRLVRLETKVCLKFEELDKALVLARESTAKELDRASTAMNTRLEGMNEFREQMNKQEATYAKKETVNKELDDIKKLLYMGIGIVIALQFVFSLLVK